MINKWDVVSAVWEEYETCMNCEYHNDGDCNILMLDNMVAEFCAGFDEKLEELEEEQNNA